MKSPTFAPAYVALFPHLAEVAQANGYALCVHGSVGRDFDLVAAPWTDEAVDAETLFWAIAKQCNVSTGKLVDPVLSGVTEYTDKPHGRKAWSILLGFGAVIDLSVMPRQAAQPAPVEDADIDRPCTCHPLDSPPVPCAKKYALDECKASTTCSWCGKPWNKHGGMEMNYHTANIARSSAKRDGAQ